MKMLMEEIYKIWTEIKNMRSNCNEIKSSVKLYIKKYSIGGNNHRKDEFEFSLNTNENY